MLIYNFQKEFIGIDEKDLKTLGFKNLGELRTEVTDFADLFVKTPGFIHNFKHVHWIDFITCADSNEESKVIINVNNNNYRAIIHISTAYLIDNPTSKSYIINLQNLRELTHKESENIAGDIIQREPVQAVAPAKAIFNTPEYTNTFVNDEDNSFQEESSNDTLIVDDYDSPLNVDIKDEMELPIDDFDKEVEEITPKEIEKEEDLSIPLEISFDDDLEDDLILDTSSSDDEKPVTTVTQVVKESFDNGYVYDPNVASEELGLPLDLIEEFIQDFIEQAKEFKSELYKAIDVGDFDTIKTLSHKLKGVAANLRVEDALEALTITNTSSDFNEITENIEIFYKIISKLAGEEISVEKEIEIVDTPLEIKDETTIETDTDDDLYSDPIEIEDSDVPAKIDIPELADDTFLEIVEDDNSDEMLTLELNEDDTDNNDEMLTLELDKDDTDDSDEMLTLELDKDDTDDSDDMLTLELDEDDTDDSDDMLTLELDEDDTDDSDEMLTLELDEDDTTDNSEIDTPLDIEYSKETVASEIGLDIESFNELFDDFKRETNALMTSMNSAIEKENFSLCASEAIKLKGMSENMRVIAYEDELNTLIHSEDKIALSTALNKINATLAQLSK